MKFYRNNHIIRILDWRFFFSHVNVTDISPSKFKLGIPLKYAFTFFFLSSLLYLFGENIYSCSLVWYFNILVCIFSPIELVIHILSYGPAFLLLLFTFRLLIHERTSNQKVTYTCEFTSRYSTNYSEEFLIHDVSRK